MHLRALLLALPLSVVVSAAHAKPGQPTIQPTVKPIPKTKRLPGPKPTSKVLPIPQKLQPLDIVPPRLDPKIARALRNSNPLSKKQIAAIASKFSIHVNPNDVLAPTSLTVRQPYRGPGAYLSFPRSGAVHPETYPVGVASIDGEGTMRRVRGTGPAMTPATTQDDLNRQIDPLNPGFPSDAQATVDGGYLAIHLLAAPDRDYVVSCRVSDVVVDGFGSAYEHTYGALVEVDGSYSHVIRGVSPNGGRVSLAIPRATAKRSIDLQLVAYHEIQPTDAFGFGGLIAGQHMLLPFIVSRCDLTPIE